jgi:hypothetical protein
MCSISLPASKDSAVNASWASSNPTQLWPYHLVVVSDPIGQGLSPQHCPQFRHLLQVQTPGTSDWRDVEVPMTLPLGLMNLLEWLTELRETLRFTGLL